VNRPSERTSSVDACRASTAKVWAAGEQDSRDQPDARRLRCDRSEHHEGVRTIRVLLDSAVLRSCRRHRDLHLGGVEDVLTVHDIVDTESLQGGDEVRQVT